MAESEKVPTTRRGVLRGLAGTLGAALALTAAGKQPAAAETPAAPAARPQAAAASAAPLTSDPLGRMHAELQRALAKPRQERRWVMVIDLRKCVGCHACTIACVAENKLPPGVVYRPVLEEEIGTYPNVTRRFIPRPCMQCDNPPCTPVCPVHATWKNEDGVVVVDYNQCIGCRYCLTACPYGARTSDFGHTYTAATPHAQAGVLGQETADDYERVANFEYGKPWDRQHEGSPIGNARKCHFCLHRIAEGLLPACVTTCIGRATMFGDANDPDSLVAEMIAKPNVMRLKEEMGTEPRVYYLL
ncbi:MAG: 4Fe-4S dicluster domain-containing protein [Anaerolineae bacterium]